MKIGINTLFLIPNKVGGTEYYSRSILLYLEKLDKKNQYIIFCNKENYNTFYFKSKRFRKVLCPINAESKFLRIIYEQLAFPFRVLKEDCDILHSFGYFGPILKLGWKSITTIHDANWKDHPRDSNLLINIVLNLLINLSIFTSNLIVTDSSYAKSRLKKYFSKHAHKIKIIWPGINKDFYKLLRASTKNFQKNKKYILCVSAFYPHKNIPYLLSLWSEFNKTNKTYQLILIGQNGTDHNRILKKIKKIKNILWYKKVSFKKLVKFYKKASLFIFPSTYEGFGFPVYEAVATNLNVLVGKKDMYHHSILPKLNELSFDIKKDVKILKKNLKKKSNNIEISINYNNSTKILIREYENLFLK